MKLLGLDAFGCLLPGRLLPRLYGDKSVSKLRQPPAGYSCAVLRCCLRIITVVAMNSSVSVRPTKVYFFRGLVASLIAPCVFKFWSIRSFT
jgi:hypothetical protein